MDLEFYKKEAQKKQKEHRKFLGRLSAKPPKNPDSITEETHNEVFAKINCLDCANCCKTTGPFFTTKDIERISKHLKMKPKDFELKFLQIDEDQDLVLQNLRCWFLGENNECTIYDVRPKACREYPHTDMQKFYKINSLMIKNTLICPAAFVWVEKMNVKINGEPKNPK